MGIYFLAAGKSSRNRDRTLDTGHSVEEIGRYLSPPDVTRLCSFFGDDEPVFLWGANGDTELRCVRPDEYVVDVKNKVVAQIFSFCFWVYTSDTRLQAYVRWDEEKPKEKRRSYRYVYFLRHPLRTKRAEKAYFQNAFRELAN